MLKVAPGLELPAQAGEVDPFFVVAKPFQLPPTLIEKRTKPGGIATRVVVESCGDLDETVKERFLFAFGLQPDRFERLVGFEILLCVEQANAFFKSSIHRSAL